MLVVFSSSSKLLESGRREPYWFLCIENISIIHPQPADQEIVMSVKLSSLSLVGLGGSQPYGRCGKRQGVSYNTAPRCGIPHLSVALGSVIQVRETEMW